MDPRDSSDRPAGVGNEIDTGQGVMASWVGKEEGQSWVTCDTAPWDILRHLDVRVWHPKRQIWPTRVRGNTRVGIYTSTGLGGDMFQGEGSGQRTEDNSVRSGVGHKAKCC